MLKTSFSEVPLRCRCGALRGVASEVAPTTGLRLVCYCKDCQAFARYLDRLGRGWAVICDILDPDVIVLGGGLSNVAELYPAIGPAIAPHVFTDSFTTPVRPAEHGD